MNEWKSSWNNLLLIRNIIDINIDRKSDAVLNVNIWTKHKRGLTNVLLIPNCMRCNCASCLALYCQFTHSYAQWFVCSTTSTKMAPTNWCFMQITQIWVKTNLIIHDASFSVRKCLASTWSHFSIWNVDLI